MVNIINILIAIAFQRSSTILYSFSHCVTVSFSLLSSSALDFCLLYFLHTQQAKFFWKKKGNTIYWIHTIILWSQQFTDE